MSDPDGGVTPGYWMNETSGVLRPAVEAFINQEAMTPEQIAAMRAYLRQWVNAPLFRNVEGLRSRIDSLTTQQAIEAWIDDAIEAGVDPL